MGLLVATFATVAAFGRVAVGHGDSLLSAPTTFWGLGAGQHIVVGPVAITAGHWW